MSDAAHQTAPAAPPPGETWGGAELLAALQAAARWLEQHAAAVNALNVFPVPDGDTGTNMALTMNGALQDVAPELSAAAVADQVRYGALMRGRGNSGIILSQVLRGLAQGLAGHERMGAPELAVALAQASATAYQAVMTPIEGTMLTVIREASEAARAAADGGAPLAETLAAAAAAAHASVRRTPELLKTLADAGVVDAGGQGLALLLDGMLRYARGEALTLAADAPRAAGAVAFADLHGPDDFGYCTNLIIQGAGMPFDDIRRRLAAMGQSAVIVGDQELIKVHIHTRRPGDILNYAVQFGALTGIEITNMDAQRAALHNGRQTADGGRGDTEARRHPAVENGSAPFSAPPASPPPVSEPAASIATVGVVAVAPGSGFAAIFRSLQAAAVVEGGPTMNPSTADLLAAIEGAPQEEIILLPNNGNVVMAARQAAHLSRKRVAVVPSQTVPQGLAAMLALNFGAGLEANTAAMTRALGDVRTGEITRAVRDATVDGLEVRAGQTIGLIDGALALADDSPARVLDALLDRMELEEREIVAVYYGQDVPPGDAEALAARISARFPELAVEVRAGGQPLYDYIISAE
jgi:DAK2 domain fusion protein YloV